MAALLAAQETAVTAIEALLAELPGEQVMQLVACVPMTEGHGSLLCAPLVDLLIRPRGFA